MKSIDIIVVVDVDGALATSDLSRNVYMVDNNGNFFLPYFPSTGEGTHELMTSCQRLTQINWRVVPVDPRTAAEILSFEGHAIAEKIIEPRPDGGRAPAQAWSGVVSDKAPIGKKIQYSATLELGPHRTKMHFDPYLFLSPVILPTEN